MNKAQNPYSKKFSYKQKAERNLIRLFFKLNSYFVAGILLIVFLFILDEGRNVLEHIEIFNFFTETSPGEYEWFPTSVNERYSVIPLIIGSLLTSIPAVLISTFCGITIGIYLAEFANVRLKEILKPAFELFSGIPTVIIGFFMFSVGSVIFDDLFSPDNTLNAFIASIGLSFIVIPIIASLTEEALSQIPKEIRMGSYALGASKWQTLKLVTFPAAVKGISSGVIIGFCRAIGETMIVLMVSGNAASITTNLFKSVRTMSATIGAEMGEVVYQSEHYYALFLIGIILFTLTFVLNLIAEYLTKKIQKYND